MGPVCEYSLHPVSHNHQELSKDAKYIIQVPHVIKDVKKNKEKVRVRHGDIHSSDIMLHPGMDRQQGGVYYKVGEKDVVIHTKTLGGFIVTAEGLNCCSRSANILLFGSLRNFPQADSLVTIKVYFASVLSEIKDYEAVSFLIVLLFL